MNISGPAAVAKPEMLFYAPGDLTVTKQRQYEKMCKEFITHSLHIFALIIIPSAVFHFQQPAEQSGA